MRGIVNKIIEVSFIDGPGSRMAIFLQGCNLDCLYCHNPETKKYCQNCGRCVEQCPAGALTNLDGRVTWDKAICHGCDRCLEVCPHSSSPKTTLWEVEDLVAYILENEVFLDGVTFSGGECTLQADFILEVSHKLKEKSNLTVFVDTNCFLEEEKFLTLCQNIDGIMADLKAFDPVLHRKLTGVANELIFQNLNTASQLGVLYEVRTVLVPGLNDHPQEVKNIARFIRELNSYTLLKLIPFRNYGVKSYLKEAPNLPEEKFFELFEVATEILGSRVYGKYSI
ncbi:YjjW family glycine radical enzyme activase [Carboxydothermus pertinax]|uniref:YjjW family glycine radical enzyme activase n=1 Tax=Carboxydothermus pertinax TaxID=870242 RepID=UPI00096AADC0|nr:YjjW family glycine radical enzyme activase [Carboxydothermus pertinax]